MGKVFAVTSGKGGAGKSTLSVGLALAFCRNEKTVLLVDMDEGLRCLDLMLGVDQKTVLDLSDVLLGADIADAVSSIPGESRLKLLPAPANYGRIDLFSLTRFARQAPNEYDVVIFDFPAGIDFSLYEALPDDTLFLTVANPDPVSVRDSAAVSAALERKGLSSRMIINNFNRKLIRAKILSGIDDMIDASGLQLIGIVPESRELHFFATTHTINLTGKAMKAFLRIVRRLYGEDVPLPAPNKI